MLRIACVISFVVVSLSSAFGGTTGTLEGRVVDKESGEGLAGVSVFIVGSMQGAATDSDGQFQITNLPVGTYDVRFSTIGYKILLYKDVSIHSDIKTRLAVELVPSAVEGVRGEILGPRPLVLKGGNHPQIFPRNSPNTPLCRPTRSRC